MTDPQSIDTTLEHVFDALTEVPAFPEAVQKALAILEDPDSTHAHVADVLRYDPALTANVLKVANSAHFGLPRQVTSVETALALLGVREIREILIASGSRPYLDQQMPGYGMSAHALWTHSLGCAAASGVVARRFRFDAPEALFTASLLHDIGKIILDLYVGARIEEVLILARTEKIAFTEAEWKVIGTDHAILGSELLRLWNFPQDIVRAVRNHHDPDLYVQDELSSLLSLTNIVAVTLGLGVGIDGFRHHVPRSLVDRLGLGAADFPAILAESHGAVEEVSSIFT